MDRDPHSKCAPPIVAVDGASSIRIPPLMTLTVQGNRPIPLIATDTLEVNGKLLRRNARGQWGRRRVR